MKYYLNVLKNYATFSGRARRSEYWYFALFNVIFAVAAMILDKALGTNFTVETAALIFYPFHSSKLVIEIICNFIICITLTCHTH